MFSPAPPAIRVRVEKGTVDRADYTFSSPFRAGRDETCEIQLFDPLVSRFHAEFWYANGKWWVLDLGSENGTYLDGAQVEQAPLPMLTRVVLGQDGPVLRVIIEQEPKKQAAVEGHKDAEPSQRDALSMTQMMEHYFQGTRGDTVGEHTMMIRQAFKKVQKRQRRKFVAVIAAVFCLFLAAGMVALLKHREVQKQETLAQEMFYAMKSLELEFAPFLKIARLRQDPYSVKQVQQYRAKRRELEKKYDKFIETLEIYQKKISEEERNILRMARTFGECELTMPQGFLKEVYAYIDDWKSTTRLKNAIEWAAQKGYTNKIAAIMLNNDLPPHFFYIALQESNFRTHAVGPETAFGFPKGMWQFLPGTAAMYDLRTGPLQHLPQPDPRDERHDFEKSTLAAAKYLRDIYDTDAQASGLLVMASYNWGERRVNRLIKEMPENPQDRNFWQLLLRYRNQIPKETHDYVFHVFSAAVIGENPGLFGFGFENPLSSAGIIRLSPG
jgi:hypothetical protein